MSSMSNNPIWAKETKALCDIALECGLVEETKWDKPAFTLDGKIILVVQAFKKYAAMLFVKGALIDDGKGILTKTGKNTVVGRQIKVTSQEEILKLKNEIKKYIKKAIEVEKSGKKLDSEISSAKPDVPTELQEYFDEMPDFKAAWDKLTPGRQKGYLMFFNDAKYEETRRNRIEKYIDSIFDGYGLHDRYLGKTK